MSVQRGKQASSDRQETGFDRGSYGKLLLPAYTMQQKTLFASQCLTLILVTALKWVSWAKLPSRRGGRNWPAQLPLDIDVNGKT